MTTRILVVDDEPDLEALVLQKFRHQIRDKTVSFTFAHDGVEALAALKANGDVLGLSGHGVLPLIRAAPTLFPVLLFIRAQNETVK